MTPPRNVRFCVQEIEEVVDNVPNAMHFLDRIKARYPAEQGETYERFLTIIHMCREEDSARGPNGTPMRTENDVRNYHIFVLSTPGCDETS
jgi:hypothetical protein